MKYGSFATKSSHLRETVHKQAKTCLFMTTSKDFSSGDILLFQLFRLISDIGHRVEPSHLKPRTILYFIENG